MYDPLTDPLVYGIESTPAGHLDEDTRHAREMRLSCSQLAARLHEVGDTLGDDVLGTARKLAAFVLDSEKPDPADDPRGSL
ncbi:hypothetical protein I5H08_gp001 [Mycobacterium phage Yuna]|uniref:Gene 1 ring forming protein domain-containing protein n=1 Tax=Mycobacterium phage Yuna TaxID=2599885 RepID=A0A5J6TH01_9CAUD|nr:hypothetical protein I5H08_gp001 [Mycobacterium phage Yuna]QFG09384.1 hypothetical protein PBI_YUNA_1 [Mycobacterium phage Yuna]